MKKQMRFAAMLAGAVMLCGTIPAAPVTALHCWGTADGSEFQDMTLLDDKGMFSGVPRGEGIGTADNYQVFTYHFSFDREETWTDLDTGETKTEMRHHEGDPVYVVCPRENILRIVLRKELDHAEAEQKMYEILEHYYPGVRSNECPNCSVYQVTVGVPDLECYYDLVDNSKRFPTEEAKTAGVPEIADGILHDLAKAGLISEFYTWGQTANYQQVTLHSRNASPTVYFPEGWYWDEAEHKTVTINYDWEAIEAYVKEHHPECEFVRVTLEDTELAKEIGYYDYEQNRVYFGNYDEMYAVIPPDGTTFSEHFAIAADLYAEFGIACKWACPESTGSSLTGQNALTAAGDVNLDCSIDVSDAVLVARFAAEDREAVITDQGRQNADVTHDGNVDSQDAAKILQYIAKKISFEDLAK
ncbi:MAG: dockerin type I repeat-containing protein [Acutalibacteraceae bacterium]|nr:dockerin type I repeat-containing protein [Acutalibacteraceae bacterium]